MDIHRIIEATLQVKEEDMMQANEPTAPEAPAAPAVAEKPEITPELIDSLIADIPELADCDKEMLIKGMTAEMEHFDTVGGDVAIVARIACDHIKEFPGKDYYAALDTMEQGLVETPEEEPAAPTPAAEEAPAETETPKVESPFESKKEPKEDEQVEMKKEANKKEEDRINKKAAEKK